jgi:hypothetical protein
LPSLRAHADDFDSDPVGRRSLPSFYGYLPDEGNKRTTMYACMVLNSALLLLLRSIGAALLMLADTKIFVAYMAGDHLLYLLQKLVRGDFLYWLPMEGVVGLALSLLVRVAVKTLTDFTGVLQLRAAGELGGVMWLWTMVLALVAPWAAVPVYFGSLTSNSTNFIDTETVLDSTDSTTDAWELEQSDVWRLLGGLTASWVRARRTEASPHSNLSLRTLCGRAHVRPSLCAAEHVCGRAHMRPSTCAAEHMCGTCATSPAAGGVRGVCPRQPEFLPASATGDPPRARSCTPTLLC